MNPRYLIAIALLSATTLLAQTPANKPWTPPRTPWGDPDLQGVWNNATSTPLERPDRVGGKGVLNDDEAGEFQQQLANELSRDRRDGSAEADVARAYNEHWMDAHRLRIADRQTSLIVDPPDGHIPPLVPLSPERAKAKADRAAKTARVNAVVLRGPKCVRGDFPASLSRINDDNLHHRGGAMWRRSRSFSLQTYSSRSPSAFRRKSSVTVQGRV